MKDRLSGKTLILGLQHVFAMFGATVLVPILTGLNPSVALFGAGLGTLIFHLCTKGIVPVFLGSSFAFISAIQYIGAKYGLEYALGGCIAAGFMYLIYALIIHFIGADKIRQWLSPTVMGTMIIIIGLTLAPSVINSYIVEADVGTLEQRWIIAFSVMLTMVIVSIYAKGFFKLIPILFGIAVGYIISSIFGLVDFTVLSNAKWFEIPQFIFPKFNLESILYIAPISLVTFMEHIGDVTTIGNTVGQDFFTKPKITRTLMGDGIATMFAGMIGAPPNTTYSENTGVIAITKVYNPFILRVAAVISIILAFIGKLGILLQTIPAPIMGGISIILFGFIASVGIRTLIDAKVDFSNNKNALICAIMLVLGISGVVLPIGELKLAGLSLSALVGIILNIMLPDEKA